MEDAAALTSCVSILETLVATCCSIFHSERKKTCLIIGALAAVSSIIICLGYNVFYFEITLPNGSVGQLLDIMDYVSNSFLMPITSLLTAIFVGWVMKPKWIADEMKLQNHQFRGEKIYKGMVRFVVPVIMAALFVQSTGLFS